MITENLSVADQPVLPEYSKVMVGVGLFADSQARTGQSPQAEHFHSKAVGRLYLAIVNQAILDVLEKGEDSAAAEQWLLSGHFDRLQELFR